MIPSRKIANLLSCRIKRCTGKVLSRRIASLLDRQMSTLAVAREMYGYDTKPENCESAGQANQHFSYCSGYGTEPGNRNFAEKANQHSSCCSGYGTEPEIANLLNKQISTLAVAREMYRYDTKSEDREFAKQANQHSSCCSRGVWIWY